jgi:cytochrome P450
VIASDAAFQQEQARPLSEAEVLGNMFFYVMAGYDTTSTTLSFVFLLLALHPSCQLLLQQQLDQVLGSKPTSEWSMDDDFPRLFRGYLGAVISETLRLYHPVAWYARKAVNLTTVTDCHGMTRIVPAGTTIMIDVAALGRHPGYWTAGVARNKDEGRSPALDFDPSRWLKNGELEHLKSEAAFPFSTGHRMCPGKRFAELEMCAMTARFFSQFSLRLESNGLSDHELNQKAANALFEGLGFGHGIYPKRHVPLKIILREDKVGY